MEKLKIIADENIPLVKELFAGFGELVLMPGRQINASAVKNADILLIRSITPINEQLLENSNVKFIGSATTGVDHVDFHWLQQTSILFADAAGCNAQAVAEYVVCCIASLRKQGFLLNKSLRAGVIGIGKVGSRVVERLKILGFEVLENDPPRQMQDKNFTSTDLNEFHDLDLICLHTPLTKTGPHPTFHLINQPFLQKQKPGTFLLNAGRGAVIDFADLKKQGAHLHYCFDVWEHEPDIDLDILKQASVATTHIAGYTVESKMHATFMLYKAAQKIFPFLEQKKLSSVTSKSVITLTKNIRSWEDVLIEVYDPIKDTQHMQKTLLTSSNKEKDFDELRKHHVKRHEFTSTKLHEDNLLLTHQDKKILKALGFNRQV